MKDQGSEAIDRMFKKGGRARFSLRHGSVIHVDGEKPIMLNKAMTDEEWQIHLRSMGVAPEVIYL